MRSRALALAALCAIAGCGPSEKGATKSKSADHDEAKEGAKPAATATAAAAATAAGGDGAPVAAAPAPAASAAAPQARSEPKGGAPPPGAAFVLAGTALQEEDVKRTVAANFSTFDKCLAHAGGRAKGTVSVKVAVDAEGKATEASVVKSTFRVARFDDCVAGAVKAMKFPKSGGASSFVVPIEFDK